MSGERARCRASDRARQSQAGSKRSRHHRSKPVPCFSLNARVPLLRGGTISRTGFACQPARADDRAASPPFAPAQSASAARTSSHRRSPAASSQTRRLASQSLNRGAAPTRPPDPPAAEAGLRPAGPPRRRPRRLRPPRPGVSEPPRRRLPPGVERRRTGLADAVRITADFVGPGSGFRQAGPAARFRPQQGNSVPRGAAMVSPANVVRAVPQVGSLAEYNSPRSGLGLAAQAW